MVRLRWMVLLSFAGWAAVALSQVSGSGGIAPPQALFASASTRAATRTEEAGAVAAALAMERAQRQAANPMRAIVEAAKIQRRPVDAANVLNAANADAQTARRAPVANAAQRASSPAITLRATAPEALGTLASAPAAPVTSAPSPSSLVLPTEPTAAGPLAKADVARAKASLSLAPVELVALFAPVAPLHTAGPMLAPPWTPLPSMAPPLPSTANVAPKLLTMVEPAVPPRLWDDLPRGAVLEVDLSLQADGTVASVTFASLAPRALLRVVQKAVEQWVFEALPAPRVHRVQLVLSPPPR